MISLLWWYIPPSLMLSIKLLPGGLVFKGANPDAQVGFQVRTPACLGVVLGQNIDKYS